MPGAISDLSMGHGAIDSGLGNSAKTVEKTKGSDKGMLELFGALVSKNLHSNKLQPRDAAHKEFNSLSKLLESVTDPAFKEQIRGSLLAVHDKFTKLADEVDYVSRNAGRITAADGSSVLRKLDDFQASLADLKNEVEKPGNVEFAPGWKTALGTLSLIGAVVAAVVFLPALIGTGLLTGGITLGLGVVGIAILIAIVNKGHEAPWSENNFAHEFKQKVHDTINPTLQKFLADKKLAAEAIAHTRPSPVELAAIIDILPLSSREKFELLTSPGIEKYLMSRDLNPLRGNEQRITVAPTCFTNSQAKALSPTQFTPELLQVTQKSWKDALDKEVAEKTAEGMTQDFGLDTFTQDFERFLNENELTAGDERQVLIGEPERMALKTNVADKYIAQSAEYVQARNQQALACYNNLKPYFQPDDKGIFATSVLSVLTQVFMTTMKDTCLSVACNLNVEEGQFILTGSPLFRHVHFHMDDNNKLSQVEVYFRFANDNKGGPDGKDNFKIFFGGPMVQRGEVGVVIPDENGVSISLMFHVKETESGRTLQLSSGNYLDRGVEEISQHLSTPNRGGRPTCFV